MPKEITAVIIDDEKGSRDFLSSLLETYCPWVKILGQASNIKKGLKLFLEQKPNILFLDIRMPKGSGFELLDQLESYQGKLKVIFTTAFDEFAVQAFRYSAQDYLLKPIHPLHLKKSVEKVGEEIEKVEQLVRLEHIYSILDDAEEKITTILLRSPNGQSKIELNNIVRFEADGNYTIVFLKNQKPLIAAKSLKEFDDLLTPFKFLRVHQSHLINLNMFQRYLRNKDSSGGKVELKNGDCVDVSRSKKKILLENVPW